MQEAGKLRCACLGVTDGEKLVSITPCEGTGERAGGKANLSYPNQIARKPTCLLTRVGRVMRYAVHIRAV